MESCRFENFGWIPGWQKWLAMNRQNSWRVIRLFGHLAKSSCIIPINKCGMHHLWTMIGRVHSVKRALFKCLQSHSCLMWLAVQVVLHEIKCHKKKKNPLSYILSREIIWSLIIWIQHVRRQILTLEKGKKAENSYAEREIITMQRGGKDLDTAFERSCLPGLQAHESGHSSKPKVQILDHVQSMKHPDPRG